jgi:hypothetical protein
LGDWIKNAEELAIVKTFDEKQIKDYNSSDMAGLVDLMAQWRLLLGTTSEVTAEELTFICQFLYENFGHLCFSDIRFSMMWAISGKIDLGFVSQKTLSSFYISKAINAYMDNKAEMVNRIAEAKLRHESSKPVKKLTPTEKANNFKSHIITVYKDYKEDGTLIDFGDMVYKWLKKSGCINPTPADIDEALTIGNNKYIAERQEESLKNIVLQTVNPKTENYLKRKYAREYLIKKYFDKTDIIQIVKRISPTQFEDGNN